MAREQAEHEMRDEAEVLKALDRLREGSKVSVSFVQSGLPVATVDGRWIPREQPARCGWFVFGRAGACACILVTDQVVVLRRQGGKVYLRVDLRGSRMPMTKAQVRRARLAGILPPVLRADAAPGGAA